MYRLQRSMRALVWISLSTLSLSISSTARADTVTVVTWNVSGSTAASHDSDLAAMLALVDPDVILVTEGGANAELDDNFGTDYTLVEASNGQELWLSNDPRFALGSLGTGTWVSPCNNLSIDGSWAHIVDSQSGQDLFVYVPHFCVSDNFSPAVDNDPTVSNEDQQESLCNIIGHMEDRADEGEFVVLGGDFNVQQVDEDDSIVAFLEGTNDLDPAYCDPTTTSIGMMIGAREDVQRIMGTGDATTYSNTISMSSSSLGWGQGSHGWVAVDVELAAAPAVPTLGRLGLAVLGIAMSSVGYAVSRRRRQSS